MRRIIGSVATTPSSARRVVGMMGTVATGALAVVLATAGVPTAQSARADIPRTWVDAEIRALELPLAHPEASPVHVTAAYYYQMPVRPVFRSYPIYAPGREPEGYYDRLLQTEPERLVADLSDVRSDADWARAGEIVFDAPLTYAPTPVRDPAWYRSVDPPIAADGTIAGLRYVVTGKGRVRVGILSCAMCHTRVMPDGTVLKGAQGNFPFERWNAFNIELGLTSPDVAAATRQARGFERGLFATPWAADPFAALDLAALAQPHRAIPPGVISRHRSSVRSPAQVPDLIGVAQRKYLDRTGLQLNRGLGDLMRYAALNQGADDLASFAGFVPDAPDFTTPPPPAQRERYSDEQLYALAHYVSALQPPANPNRPNAQTARGQQVFAQAGCGSCHTPPLYTNNRLAPAPGFTVPAAHRDKYDILPVSVGTDPELTMNTRRGTGYYKVPSLKGVWYRGYFEHSGSVATLEDWFDPRRLERTYVPTGWTFPVGQPRPVPGHRFGLALSADDKQALIAFLKTL